MTGPEPSSTADYPYKGVPLTPSIARDLIRQLFRGKLIESSVIRSEVLRKHLAGGGEQPIQEIDGVVRRALGNLKSEGYAENVSQGYWRIKDDDMTSDSSPAVEELLEQSDEQLASTPPPAADLDIGSGSGAVYMYYLPTYRLHAETCGERSWPCKIGRTDRDPLSRVLAQAATALPEKPHIALIVRTSKPLAWENALHGVLALRGLQMENSPGVEWFLTSPHEVLELVKQFDPQFCGVTFEQRRP